jgi:hypothetical protein
MGGWRRPASRARLAGWLGLGVAGLPANDATSEARYLLEHIVDADVEASEDGPAIRQGEVRIRVISVVDPEMRHDRKGPSRRVDGYKVHVLTDDDSE